MTSPGRMAIRVVSWTIAVVVMPSITVVVSPVAVEAPAFRFSIVGTVVALTVALTVAMVSTIPVVAAPGLPMIGVPSLPRSVGTLPPVRGPTLAMGHSNPSLVTSIVVFPMLTLTTDGVRIQRWIQQVGDLFVATETAL